MTASPSPFHSESVKKSLSAGFVVRMIERGWNDTMGHEEWHLRSIARDKRKVVISVESDLFKRLTTADPYIVSMVKDESRDIYPRLTINVKSTVVPGKYEQQGDLVSEQKLTASEQEEWDARKLTDPLHAIRRDLHLGRAEANRIILDEKEKGGENWTTRAEAAIRAAAAPKPKVEQARPLRYKVGMKASCAHCVKQYSLALSDATYDAWTATEEGGLWKCPKGHRIADPLMAIVEDKPATETPHWTALDTDDLGEMIGRVRNHFNRELQVKGLPLGEAENPHEWAACGGININASVNERGIKQTTEMLQAYLDRYTPGMQAGREINPNKPVKETPPMAKPTTETAPHFTQDEWSSWLTTNGLKASEVVRILNDHSVAKSGKAITKPSEWPGDLNFALELVKKAREATAEDTEPDNVPGEEETVPDTRAFVPSMGLPEAPFSASFKLIDKHGVEVLFSVRAESAEVGVPKVDDTIERLIKHGYATNRPASAAPSSSEAPSHETGNGLATCVMISVGESYEGKKPQLNFECDGMDKPLKFTKSISEMVKLLKTAKKMDGTPFTEADLTIGRKFPGQWKVQWSKNEKDGKTFRNVEAVQ